MLHTLHRNVLSSEIEFNIGAIMVRRNKLAEQLASLEGTIIYNKIMLHAIFRVLQEKQIVTPDEVADCASEILNKSFPEYRWLQ
jgi:hypothetical protein